MNRVVVRGRVYFRRLSHEAVLEDYRVHGARETAKRHRCSVTHVYQLASQYGVHRGRGRRPEFDLAEIAADYERESLLRLEDIAEIHGCCVDTVSRAARLHGLRRKG